MSFQVAYPDGMAVGYMVEGDIADSQAWLVGALLIRDSDFAFAECGADPAAVAAVALAPCGTDSSGFNILGSKEFPPGKMQVCPVQNKRPFTALYVGTLPAADGGSYGVVRDTDGLWKVDFNETTATVVKLIGRRTTSPENIARVIVEFLDDVVQAI